MTEVRRLLDIIERWQGKRLLVVGDLVADEHVIGRPLAVAREAPVMVLEHVSRQVLPGGATNVAANARALGAEVHVCGVIGDDEAGRTLSGELARRGIGTRGVVTDPSRPTTTKTRIWAGGAQQIQQLMLRLDRVDRSAVSDGISAGMAAHVADALGGTDALLLSDYENGVIHPGLIEACLHPAIERGVLVAVDSHGDLTRFKGATLFTPNQPEAEATLGRPLTALAELDAGGAELLERLHAKALLVTRGQEGMSLFTHQGMPLHVPTLAGTAAVDPTGAGDTVAAAFTLAVVAGAALADAVTLASIAASIVVARVGTAVASAEDLRAALHAVMKDGS